jgi:hypothetical protein
VAVRTGKWWDGGAWDIEPCAEVTPAADAELGTGLLGERKEGIARVATEITTGRQRGPPVAPDIPAFAEIGLPAVSHSAWFGLFAPKRTAKPVFQALGPWTMRRGRTVQR